VATRHRGKSFDQKFARNGNLRSGVRGKKKTRQKVHDPSKRQDHVLFLLRRLHAGAYHSRPYAKTRRQEKSEKGWIHRLLERKRVSTSCEKNCLPGKKACRPKKKEDKNELSNRVMQGPTREEGGPKEREGEWSLHSQKRGEKKKNEYPSTARKKKK